MIQDPLKSGRLIALFLAGMVLFNYPILSLFNFNSTVLGIPILYFYIFLAWCLVIGLMVLITDAHRTSPSGDTEQYRD